MEGTQGRPALEQSEMIRHGCVYREPPALDYCSSTATFSGKKQPQIRLIGLETQMAHHFPFYCDSEGGSVHNMATSMMSQAVIHIGRYGE